MMVRGLVTKIKTSVAVSYLGSLLYELGHIDSTVLNESLRDLSRNKWLHGEILLTRGAITAVQLAEGMHEQTVRKLVHLFSLPPETTYAFESDVDKKLRAYGGADWPAASDPSSAVDGVGVRDGAWPMRRESESLPSRRRKSCVFRLYQRHRRRRLRPLERREQAGPRRMPPRARAHREVRLVDRAGLDAARARALLYFLLVTKQAEPTDTEAACVQAYRPVGAGCIGGLAEHAPPTVREMPAVGSAPRISVSPRSARADRVGAVARGRSCHGVLLVGQDRRRRRAERGVGEDADLESVAAHHDGRRHLGRGARPDHDGRQESMTSAADFVRRALVLLPHSCRAPVALRRPADASRRRKRRSADSLHSPRTISPRRRALAHPTASPRPTVKSSPSERHVSRSLVAASHQREARRCARHVGHAHAAPLDRLAQLEGHRRGFSRRRRQSIFERARAVLKEDYFQRLSLSRDSRPSSRSISRFSALQTLWDPENAVAAGPHRSEGRRGVRHVVPPPRRTTTLRDLAARSRLLPQQV